MAELSFEQNCNLAPYHTFGCEVKTDWLVRIESPEQLKAALDWARQQALPLCLLGEGSNVLFADRWPGLVLVIATRGISLMSENTESVLVEVAAGENWHGWVEYCLAQSWYGLENLALIPGTVGAAPVQNIGAYGVEQSEYFDSAQVMDVASGELHWLDASQCLFGYRDSLFKQQGRERFVILNVRYRLSKLARPQLSYGGLSDWLARQGIDNPTPEQVFQAVCDIRRSKLPDPAQLVSFAQADGSVKLAAGWLIDQAGWKGFRQGDAGVHARQALVLVNYGQATSQQILNLAGRIQADILPRFGVELEIEPRLYPDVIQDTAAISR